MSYKVARRIFVIFVIPLRARRKDSKKNKEKTVEAQRGKKKEGRGSSLLISEGTQQNAIREIGEITEKAKGGAIVEWEGRAVRKSDLHEQQGWFERRPWKL